MCSFPEEQVGISKYLNINSTLPILVNQDSNFDVETKAFDIQNDKSASSKKLQIEILTGKSRR